MSYSPRSLVAKAKRETLYPYYGVFRVGHGHDYQYVIVKANKRRQAEDKIYEKYSRQAIHKVCSEQEFIQKGYVAYYGFSEVKE